MRDDLSGAAATVVTTNMIRQANGVAFADDGTLYVTSFEMGRLFRLTLDGSGVETARDTIRDTLPASPHRASRPPVSQGASDVIRGK